MHITEMTSKEQISATLISKLCWHVSMENSVFLFSDLDFLIFLKFILRFIMTNNHHLQNQLKLFSIVLTLVGRVSFFFKSLHLLNYERYIE